MDNATTDAIAPAPSRAERDPWTPGFGNAYWNPVELAGVLCRKVTGPRAAAMGRANFVSQDFVLNEVEPEFSVVAMGDVLPHGEYAFEVESAVRDFITDSDYLLANFEGVIAERRRVCNAVQHDPGIIDWVASLAPRRSICVTVANNHAGDCGYQALRGSIEQLQARGIVVVGTFDAPHVTIDDAITVSAGTQWSNTPTPYVIGLRKGGPAPPPEIDTFKVLMPHWGKEMSLVRSPFQRRRVEGYLKEWDAVLGSHPHCPQALQAHDGQLVAYSLGNFCWGIQPRWPLYGIVTKFTVGRDAERAWRVGRVQWKFVKQVNSSSERSIQITLSSECSLMPSPA